MFNDLLSKASGLGIPGMGSPIDLLKMAGDNLNKDMLDMGVKQFLNLPEGTNLEGIYQAIRVAAEGLSQEAAQPDMLAQLASLPITGEQINEIASKIWNLTQDAREANMLDKVLSLI